MGLGPGGKSCLLDRVGRGTLPTEDWIAMEQTERGDARRLARIRHAMKHKAVKKPEAPVEAVEKAIGIERQWTWIGESIGSKGLLHGKIYIGAEVRKAGFRLPKLKKKKKAKEHEG